MTWNGRKLMSYTTDYLAVTYSYDSDGLRTQKIVDGVQHDYYYVDGLLRYERKADAYELFYRYDQNGTLVSIVRNRFSDGANHKLYAVTNTRGDVIELRNGNGTLNTKYIYDAWGKLISVTTATGAQHTANTMGMQNSVRYRGYVYDRETGLYYLQSRYYDPETGRFLNADDVDYIGYSGENLSYNAFAYCENNAVNCIDKVGRILEHLFITVFTWYAMIEIITSFLEDYLGVKKVLDIRSFDENYETGMFDCRVKYSITDKHWLSLIVGDKNAWEKSCVSDNMLNNTSIDVFSALAEFSGGNMGDPDYNINVMFSYLLISFFGIFATHLDANYKSSNAQKVYDQIWGSNGLDPNNQYGYYGFKISNAESENTVTITNGYHAYSVNKQQGDVIYI